MSICKRCGRCCFYMKQGKMTKCRFLVRLSKKTTVCRIYDKKSRVGTIIDKGDDNLVRCIEREKSNWDYTDCPYNTNKPILL